MAIIASRADLFPENIADVKRAGHRLQSIDAIARADLRSTEALICLLSDRIDAAVLHRAPQLRVVANVAVGYENIDVDAATERGIHVTNTPDVLTESTADHTLALLLAAARRIVEADTAVREGRFPTWGLQQALSGIDVHGKTLGIVGMGRIGAAVARRARHGFGMSILYHARAPKPDVENGLDARYMSLEQLLASSDFVSLHVPFTPETHHLFDALAFERMKSSAILINVARGAVVDEAALAQALQTGQIAGAGLDVYEDEPNVHPELLKLKKHVVLAPHLGSATEETRRAMADLAIRNVLAVLAGKPPLTPVPPPSTHEQPKM